MPRTFDDKPATREKVPLLVGLMGPSGGGKTYSALRLATGIQRVSGGEIYVVDTEARRSLHYADKFKFRHVEFGAPFGSLDYLAAIEHCVKKGAGVVVVDSMSHEHEGPGGMLEAHQAEVDRLAGGTNAEQWKKDANKMLAWGKPKADRRRLINTILQMNANFIFCFRAKEKIKLPSKAEKEAAKGRGERVDPVKQMGFMPIAGDEFIFEMTANCLLLPNAGGIPTWQSDEVGERMMIKKPEQFRQLFSAERPLDEQVGQGLAQWAVGDSAAPDDSECEVALEAIRNAPTKDVVKTLAKQYSAKPWNATQKKSIRSALETRNAELSEDPEPSSEEAAE